MDRADVRATVLDYAERAHAAADHLRRARAWHGWRASRFASAVERFLIALLGLPQSGIDQMTGLDRRVAGRLIEAIVQDIDACVDARPDDLARDRRLVELLYELRRAAESIDRGVAPMLDAADERRRPTTPGVIRTPGHHPHAAA